MNELETEDFVFDQILETIKKYTPLSIDEDTRKENGEITLFYNGYCFHIVITNMGMKFTHYSYNKGEKL